MEYSKSILWGHPQANKDGVKIGFDCLEVMGTYGRFIVDISTSTVDYVLAALSGGRTQSGPSCMLQLLTYAHDSPRTILYVPVPAR